MLFRSLAITQQWAAKYPAGQLDAIVAQGPQITGDAAWAFGNGRSDILFIAGDYNTDVQKAIVDGQVYGTVEQNPDLQGREAITAIAQRHGLAVVEDGAEALGAVRQGRKIGTHGSPTIFAFYPNKQMTTGEGGIVTTDDDDEIGRAHV